MKKGQKVLTTERKIETVMNIEEARIITFESAKQNNWWHPSKLIPVFWSNNLKKYVTIPNG